MKIKRSYIYNNQTYKLNRHMTPNFLVLHSTGDAVSSAYDHVKYYNKPDINVSVHAFIDGHTGEVWQTLPWSVQAWHAGGVINRNSIGVEMCEPDAMRYSGGASIVDADIKKCMPIVHRTYDTAVELFAFLCQLFGIRSTMIYGHGELRSAGLSTSTHVDPEHLWTQLGTSYTMDGFRKDVYEMLREPVYNTLDEVPPAYRPTVEKLVKLGIIGGTSEGLDLNRTICRVLVFNDRAGLYG